MREILQRALTKRGRKAFSKKLLYCLLTSAGLSLCSGESQSQTLAFPGAMGFGRFAPGARGADASAREVYVVTNLNDSGSGSFRDAVSKQGRIVVFAVGGLIRITTDVVVSSNVTIEGQTAPGSGITILGKRVTFTGANNTIARYIRIRYGGTDKDVDASGLASGANMIFDHVSFSWGTDEVFSINYDGKGTSIDNITLQNCIISQGIHRHNHSASGLIQPPSGGKVSLIQNLYISNKTRNPKVKGVNEFVNNVVYNWGNANRLGATMNYGWSGEAYIMGGDSDGESFVNILNNYFVSGPSTKPGTSTPFSRGNSNFNLYGSGNFFDGNQNGVLDGAEVPYTTAGYPTGDAAALMNTPFDYPAKTPKFSAQEAYQYIIDSVGACYPRRDQVDSLLVSEVASNGTKGYYVYVPSDLPFINGGAGSVYNAKSPLDSDSDGMPDSWEEANGLDKNSKADATVMNTLKPEYMNIEVYANGITATAPAVFVIPPDNLSLTSNTSIETQKSTVLVKWLANTIDETHFVLERSANGSTFTQIAQPPANSTSYTDDNLNPNTTYYYRIKAVTATDESVYTQTVTIKTSPVPGVYAYQTGDYRSAKSGDWAAADTWNVFDGTNWTVASAAPAAAVPPAAQPVGTVYIAAGHTVTLGATTTANNLVIDNGAVLKSVSSTRNLRLVGSLLNYGTVGSATAAEKITFEAYQKEGTVTVGGSGTYLMAAFLVNSLAQTLDVVIDADISLANSLRAYYSLTSGQTEGQDDDNVTITINAGKTVTMTGSSSNAGYLHNNNVTTITAANFGNYTYTINGTLDMKATSTSCIIPHSTLDRNVTVNTNGTWLTGNAMRIVSTATSTTPGNSYFNIGPNGLVDGAARAVGSTATTNFVFAPAAGINKYPYFSISGNGQLKRLVAANATTTFPVGSEGTYSPVSVTNGATAGGFSVNVSTAETYGKRAVTKQWTISPDFAASGVKAAFSWLSEDHSEGFVPADAAIYNYEGAEWKSAASTITPDRAGTLVSPYQVSLTNATSSLGTFMVASEQPVGTPSVLPLKLLSFEAKLSNGLTKMVQLNWITSNEVNTADFVIERKANKGFEAIGTVTAKSTSGLNRYSFTDYTPAAGHSYYRLKMQDLDGKYRYSNLQAVLNSEEGGLLIYPNPASSVISIRHPEAVQNTVLNVYNANGQLLLSRQVSKGAIQTSGIDISHLSAGFYLISYQNDLKPLVLKFMKR